MGIIAVRHNSPASSCKSDIYFGLYGINHMGQESCGMAFFDGKEPQRVYHNGLVRELDPENKDGYCGVGFVGTTKDYQPWIFYSPKLGDHTVVFDGVILNDTELRKTFKGPFSNKSYTELAAKLIAQGDDFVEGFEIMAERINGPYCVSVINQDGEIYSARCPLATRPLVLGEGKKGHAAISESRSLGKIDMKLVRDFEAGEVMVFNGRGAETVKTIKVPNKKKKICSFLHGYHSWVDCEVDGIPVNVVRERCGSTLAEHDREDGIEIDVAIPVPDSGKAYAEGYASGYPCFHSDALIKYPYYVRSYTQPTKEDRDRVAGFKIYGVRSRIEGKKIALCDDSIRRGTQLGRSTLRILREFNPEEIHVRIGTPKNRAYCRMDPQTLNADDSELFANRYRDENEMARALEVDSVRFVSTDEFTDALTEDFELTEKDFCLGCYNRDFSFLDKRL